MQPTVIFRDFEVRDIDFIYKCKNDEELNSLIVGHYHPFSCEEAVKWVHGCMGEHETYKFWAVCTNDDERRIVGWTSLSDINLIDKSAFCYSTVIGDKAYRNGLAFLECYLFVLDYGFRVLKLNRLETTCLSIQKASRMYSETFFFVQEGVQRSAAYKAGEFLDVVQYSLLYDEYVMHMNNGDYDRNKIIRRLVQNVKKDK